MQSVLRVGYAFSSALFPRQNYDEQFVNGEFTLVSHRVCHIYAIDQSRSFNPKENIMTNSLLNAKTILAAGIVAFVLVRSESIDARIAR